MNNLLIMQFIYRHAVCRNKINKQQLFLTQRLMSSKDSSSSSSSSSSESETDSKINKSEKINKIKKMKSFERNEEDKKQTIDLLNNLLNKTENSVEQKTIRAVPKKEPKPKPPKEPELEEKIIDAAKKAAAVLGGDTEKIEADLIDKVFSAGKPTVALEDKDSQPTKPSELTLNELFAKMRVEIKPPTSKIMHTLPLSRASKIEKLLQKSNFTKNVIRPRFKSQNEELINLFGGEPLNIFDPVKTSEESQVLNRWNSLEKKEIKMMLIHPPENIFEEMIHWTEKGLLWQFPINNEFGLEEEEKVHFSEHIFLERYLQGWCPMKGPIRHFMDLVCIGLSKNPYITVEEKKNHILWYKDYFGDKQELLKEIGAIDKDILDTSKQVSA